MYPKSKYRGTDEAEIDVTAFLNLMIVLVPVLLLSMTFTQITVMEISLPELTGGSTVSADAQSQLEVQIVENGFNVYYPDETLIQQVPFTETEKEGPVYDFAALSLVLQEVKSQLPEKTDILISTGLQTEYQTLIQTMDAVKSYKTVVAASVVEIELFPNISLGDANSKPLQD